jgi:hypothetical protein
MTKKLYPFDHTTADGQKRLMAISMGLDSETYISKIIDIIPNKDYGCDPLGDGTFKMIPSGKIVTKEEKEKILRGSI